MRAPISLLKKQKGFSFIELIVVIAIVIGLTIAVLARQVKVQNDSKVQAEIENVTMLATTVRNFFGTSASSGYTGLTNAVVYNSIPENMKGSGTNIRNSWNNAGITLAATGGGSTFTITSTSLPEVACEQVSAQTYASFTRLTANGTTVTSPANAATACNAATNTLVWTSQ